MPLRIFMKIKPVSTTGQNGTGRAAATAVLLTYLVGDPGDLAAEDLHPVDLRHAGMG